MQELNLQDILSKTTDLKEKIKNPFKKQQNIEEEKPLTFQEAGNIIIESLFSITTTGIAIIWAIALWEQNLIHNYLRSEILKNTI